MSAFRVGQKVVCVKRGDWVRICDGDPLDRDSVKPSYGEGCVIEGILGDFIRPGGYREWYAAAGFRPITTSTQEQDVALIKSLLRPAVHDALALVWRDQ